MHHRAFERRLSSFDFNERREPQAQVSNGATIPVLQSVEASTPTSEPVFTKPPTSVKALAAVLGVLGALIIGGFSHNFFRTWILTDI